jgi:hypothetical protein
MMDDTWMNTRIVIGVIILVATPGITFAGMGDWLTRQLGGEPEFLSRCAFQAEELIKPFGYEPIYGSEDEANEVGIWIVKSCSPCYGKLLDKHGLKNKLEMVAQRRQLLVKCLKQEAKFFDFRF